MSESNGSNGRILTLNNGRSPAKKGGDFVTRAQVEAFVNEFAERVLLPKMVEICEHYMKQVPGLTATMLGDAFTANGLTFKAPETPAGMGDDAPAQSGDAAAPESPL